MKGLNPNCCYIIDHYFYYPNKYGSHDSCCLSVLMDVVICNGNLDTGIREAASDIRIQLNEREILGFLFLTKSLTCSVVGIGKNAIQLRLQKNLLKTS